MIGIDVFAGAGGLSLGAKLAGINVHYAIEADLHSALTYRHNFPRTKVAITDIRNVKKPWMVNRKDQIILFGGPPCQGFSTSNQRTRSAANPSNWLFKEFVRLVKLYQPDWVLIENVKGILETDDGVFLEYYLKSLINLGYTLSHGVLNAADFGVPQRRARLFVIGSLHGIELPLPKPTTNEHITVGDAIADLPELENGACFDWRDYKTTPKSDYARAMRGQLRKSANHLITKSAPHIVNRFRYVPQGGNWENIPERLMENYANRSRCHTGIYYRLKASLPSIVIGNYRKNMLIHPHEDRGLSVREAARLQSFPDWFEFKGSIGFQQQQVGNAVPPLLAMAVFKNVLSV
ncbi:MAG: DNA cytosine methyltransferase [Thermodesulfovibrionales bacterium]